LRNDLNGIVAFNSPYQRMEAEKRKKQNNSDVSSSAEQS